MLYYNNMSNRSYHTARDIGVGLVVGLMSGLFGVGGGIILVPLLVLLFKSEQKRAQATSLVVVALSSVSGAATYSLAESVNWSAVPLLVAGGLLGTWLGASAVRNVRDRWLKLAFGLLLLAVAARFFFQAFQSIQTEAASLDLLSGFGYIGAGFAMGFLSSFLGVGGGIVVIPLLVNFFGFTQQVAAGTALVVMVPITLLGAVRLTKGGFTDWPQGLRIGLTATLAAVLGANIALATASSSLQLGFALLLVLAGSQMIWRAAR
jgi:uncharacterized membrane protein YfcA